MTKRKAGDAGAPQSEGQRLLLEQPGSHSVVAAEVGVSKQMVSYWRRGTKKPGRASRAKLESVYGIDPKTWDRAPGARPKEARPAPARPSSAGATTLEEVQEQLSMLRDLQRDRELLASERVRLADSVGKLLAIKARLERDQELIEDRIVREHPMWQRFRALLEWCAEVLPADRADEFEERLSSVEGVP